MLACAISVGAGQAHQPETVVALVGARVYADPAAVPVDDAVVVVTGPGSRPSAPARTCPCRRGRRRSTPPGSSSSPASRIRTCTSPTTRWGQAGSRPAAALEASLRETATRYGYTTVVDLASFPTTPRRCAAGSPPAKSPVRASSPPGRRSIRPTASPTTCATPCRPRWSNLAAAGDIGRNRAIIRAQLEGGADAVKLFTAPGSRATACWRCPPTSPRRRRPWRGRWPSVFAHPSNLAGLEVALDAGVNVLAHAVEDTRGMTATHYARMVAQGMAMVPTLHLFDGRWQWDVGDEVRTFARQGGGSCWNRRRLPAGFRPAMSTSGCRRPVWRGVESSPA